MEKEIWKDIEGYEKLYMISSYGNVKSLERIDNNNHLVKERILKLQKDKDGYLFVSLCKNGKLKIYKVHRLVALTFIPIPEHLKDIPIEKLDVGHLKTLSNGLEDKTANEIWNITWMSKSENQKYGTVSERRSKAHTNNPKKSKPVLQIDKNTNEVIAEFPSAAEAERQLGYKDTYITSCCRGKYKQAYGYFWIYKESVA